MSGFGQQSLMRELQSARDDLLGSENHRDLLPAWLQREAAG